MQGKTFVEPSFENAKQKKYPISRPLYYYYASENETLVKPYLDFAYSSKGQEIIAEIGYVPTKIDFVNLWEKKSESKKKLLRVSFT